MTKGLTDEDLDNIEGAALGRSGGLPAFAYVADTIKLVAEVRRLRKAILLLVPLAWQADPRAVLAASEEVLIEVPK